MSDPTQTRLSGVPVFKFFSYKKWKNFHIFLFSGRPSQIIWDAKNNFHCDSPYVTHVILPCLLVGEEVAAAPAACHIGHFLLPQVLTRPAEAENTNKKQGPQAGTITVFSL